jgi:hypothetical protein
MSFLVQLPRNQYPHDLILAPLTGTFSITNARVAGWLAQLAYEDEPEKIASILQDWQLQLVAKFDPLAVSILPMPKTRGLVVDGQGVRFVVFAGTDPLVLANWVSDFDFPLGPDGTHRGFAQALEAAFEQVRTALPAAATNPRLWFVGHSLGAALAALCAKRVNIRAEAVYTFGMPRVGNIAFSDGYEPILGDRTFRFVHGDDMVPSVPPSELPHGVKYRHVGRLLHCDRFGTFDAAHLATTPSDLPDFRTNLVTGVKDALRGLLSGVLAPEIRRDAVGESFRILPPGIVDHLPDRYLKALGMPPIQIP